jgi:hypothetical protein
MTQVNITINYEEMIALFSKERSEAFAYLMEKILNALLIAESEEQIGAGMHERSEDRGWCQRCQTTCHERLIVKSRGINAAK